MADMSETRRPEPDLLRKWEDKIAAAGGDPLAALADLLSQGSQRRATLFQRVGERLLGCELRTILGAGGMGVTYGGVAPEGDAVAVKLVLGVGGTSAARFEQECRLLQSFDHPAIVRYRQHAVLDDGTGVLVMDRIAGIDLEQLLQDVLGDEPPQTTAGQALLYKVEGGMALRLQSPRYRRRILRMLATVAEGLECAHRRGVVHRDVKPANVLVRDDLTPAVIDFGMARDQQAKVSFTASGMAMGTLAYMAPEQLGRDTGAVDARTDVYALGLVLYRALLGVDARQDVRNVVADSQRPFVLDVRQSRTLPVDLQAILYRCLDPRPAQRYPTMQALADDLRAAAGAGAVAARRPGWARRFVRDRRRTRPLLAFVVLACLAAGVWTWPRGREVVFAANVDAVDASLLVDGALAAALGDPVWLPFGRHSVRLSGPRLQTVDAEVVVTPGPGRQWMGMRTRYEERVSGAFLQPGRAVNHFYSGHSYVPVAPGLPIDRRWVDDAETAEWSPFPREAILPPGEHVFRARDGKGREESQRLRLDASPADIVLLPSCVADVDGSFRRTLGTVYSPLPPDLELRGDAQAWMGPARMSDIGLAGTMMTPCALTPSIGGAWCEAGVRCAFPAPMRSAVCYLQGSAQSGGELEVVAGFEGEELQPWPREANGALRPRAAFRSERGAAAFVVQARMRTATASTPVVALARFLEGMLFGGHWRSAPPCFALVADPQPDVARLAAAPAAPSPAPRLAVRRLLEVPGREPKLVLALRQRGDGARELLVGKSSDADASGVVQVHAWPGLEHRADIPASALHARAGRRDGVDFGGSLLAIADQDGDGVDELVVGDASSWRRDESEGGTVGLLPSAGGPPKWTWPADAVTSPYRDDGAHRAVAAGDWNGDGRADLAVGAPNAWRKDGGEKAGMAAVVDAASGVELWRRFGARSYGAEALQASHPAPSGRPRAILLSALLRVREEDRDLGMAFTVCYGGLGGGAMTSPDLPPGAGFGFVGAPLDERPGVAVLRLGDWHDRFVGLERFEPAAGSFRLAARQALPVTPRPRGDGVAVVRANELPDLDGDGMTDIAFGYDDVAGTTVLVVSGRELAVLGMAPLGGEFRSAESCTFAAAPGATAAEPWVLLVAGSVGSQAEGARVVAVELPRGKPAAGR